MKNIDEAAEDYVQTLCDRADDNLRIDTTLQSAFKAGAEWMAGQGVSMLGKVGIYGIDVETITEELRDAGFRLGEEVILQIRKKQ